MRPLFEGVVLLYLVALLTLTESRGDWTPEFDSQTRKKGCILGNIQRDVTFLHGTDSGDFQKLGKVADMEVCVLLCCEMDNCEAAFMADRNCYAVKCHSQEHCVTAPARKNKWHPSVVFVKRFSQSKKKDQEHQTAHAQEKQKGAHAQKEISAAHEDVENSQISESKNDKDRKAAHAQDKQRGAPQDHAQKEMFTAHGDVEKSQNSESKDNKDGQTEHAKDKQTGKSKEHFQIGTSAVHKDVKNSQIPENGDELQSNGLMNSLTIPVKNKVPVVRLDQEVTKRKSIPLDKRKMAIREDMFRKSKYSLITAAVLTCSMAVVLSGVAVIAARIRKKRETDQEHEYSSVPTAEE